MCNGLFKSKNITIHGNATIIDLKGQKLVYSVEQRKALELVIIVEEKCPVARRDGRMRKHITSCSTINQEGSTKKVQLKTASIALTDLVDHLNAPGALSSFSAYTTWSIGHSVSPES